MVDLFQPGDRRGSAVNGAIGWTKERRERVRGRRKQGSRGDRCTPRCFCFVGLTLLRCDKKKEKKRKEEEGDGDKKGEALGLACPGSPATVVRSDDTYLSTSCACIHAYTSLPFRARTRMCVSRDYTNADLYIYIYIKRTYKETRSRSKIYISAYERRSKWLLTGYIRLIGIYTIQVHFARKQCTRSVGWHAMPTGVAFSEVRCA